MGGIGESQKVPIAISGVDNNHHKRIDLSNGDENGMTIGK